MFGHHPAFPINGFPGDYQRNLEKRDSEIFWKVLVKHNVIAYICSHIMSFDVQVREGVLQILTAGAGTQPMMPEGLEYLHCVQAALDPEGLRYQVLDTEGHIREWLSWPVQLPESSRWKFLESGEYTAPVSGISVKESGRDRMIAWQFDGHFETTDTPTGSMTFVCGWSPGPGVALSG